MPRLEVVRRPGELLHRLALRWVDPWQVALVEAPPDSGFLGEQAPGDAPPPPRPTFVRDDPEAIVLDVVAPQRGFLLLADQYRGGWQATVNGAPVPILRANYVFRLVEVPAGPSRVEFRYAPRSHALGALVSGMALLVVGAVLVLTRRRRGETPAPAAPTP